MGTTLGTLKDWFVEVYEVVAGAAVFVILVVFAVAVCSLMVLAVVKVVGGVIRPGRARVLSRAEAEAQVRADEAECERGYYIWRPEEIALPLESQLAIVMRKMMAEGAATRGSIVWDIKRESLLLTYAREAGFGLIGLSIKQAAWFDRATKRIQAGVEAMKREHGGREVLVMVRRGLPTRMGVSVTLGDDVDRAASLVMKIIQGCCGGRVPKYVRIFREPREASGEVETVRGGDR